MRLIDADALKKDLTRFYDNEVTAKQLIDEQPTIEPERKTGQWIPVTNGRGGHECDQCHEYAPSWATGEEHLTNYCPNCGAKMEVRDEA